MWRENGGGRRLSYSDAHWLSLFVVQILYDAIVVGIQIKVIVGDSVVVARAVDRSWRFFFDLRRDGGGLRGRHLPRTVGLGTGRA